MKCLVTGVAGFVGSWLAEALVAEGHQVMGIDSFTDYYHRDLKENNLARLHENSSFTLLKEDLLEADLSRLLAETDWVFHQAAQAGVRASWGASFEIYTENNIRATQKLLEAARDKDLKKFVYASSSSVYGERTKLPMLEDDRLQPVSPYGVSKLAAENLCHLYAVNFGIPALSLRYFTVYGPRQRPDMAFHKFGRALLEEEEITIYGDGEQSRDFTYIEDVVAANLLAAESDLTDEILNIGGGSQVVLREVIELMEELSGKEARLKYISDQHGDVKHTRASTKKARYLLGFKPQWNLRQGLAEEIDWLSKLYG